MTSFTSGSRKKQVRFQTKDDLVLLREVLAKNPFQNNSGIDEEYGEKETLLDEILSLVEDEEKQKEKKETEENRGKDIRKRAMENLTPKKGDDDSNDATPSKRNSSGNIVGYLKEKNDAELIYRRQELEVRKQQLQLEEEKFKLEKQERILKLENDKQEKTLMFELLKKCLGDRH
ncbi:unnamed protein product [Mytilus edulis]|uniref:Uncharacterized protein n=1 Tax=Mytilus edulis TaxID=6550 RepID=A0A8S3VJA0_MYTED|nr:unnamed protein product [Mytilus edulis]